MPNKATKKDVIELTEELYRTNERLETLEAFLDFLSDNYLEENWEFILDDYLRDHVE